MESPERLRQKGLQEKRVTNRLGWAQTRLEAAEGERIWAIASAHAQGLSIRKIATATTLSSSRVHHGDFCMCAELCSAHMQKSPFSTRKTAIAVSLN
ncbi:MAG: hypothetical protein DCF25_05830 [Leptolyngbya foveolarum]|uniref:Uncharacterized protein n=1 Tax=Leptolyngbya foveolarum TaxID=47253 RepID=A0A2W4UIS0_9CYAN|nr:MAG: hypothetical protein DCF25_05830 [Leptolyngbya foveolarum]